MANTQDMLKSLENDDINGFKDQIEADLQDRIRQHIDLKKIEIAKNLVTAQQEIHLVQHRYDYPHHKSDFQDTLADLHLYVAQESRLLMADECSLYRKI